MKFVTWNVNSLRARMPRVLELLDTHQPDVVALQETKTAPDQLPHLEFAMAGYRVIDHSAGRWAGVALVVRDDLDVDEGSVRTGLPDAPLPGEARWVEARVAGTTFASVYVVNGRSPDHELFEVKLAWLDAMAARMAELAGDGSAVVGGDLNVTLADVDVWDPGRFVGSTHVTPQERSRLRGLLDAGWVDAVRHLHPDGQAFTWWDYRGGDFHRNRGLRIDYVLTTADVAAGLLSAGIDRALRKGTKPSDHAPLVATWSD